MRRSACRRSTPPVFLSDVLFGSTADQQHESRRAWQLPEPMRRSSEIRHHGRMVTADAVLAALPVLARTRPVFHLSTTGENGANATGEN